MSARPKEPNPPRVTPSELEAEVLTDADRVDEESPTKKP